MIVIKLRKNTAPDSKPKVGADKAYQRLILCRNENNAITWWTNGYPNKPDVRSHHIGIDTDDYAYTIDCPSAEDASKLFDALNLYTAFGDQHLKTVRYFWLESGVSGDVYTPLQGDDVHKINHLCSAYERINIPELKVTDFFFGRVRVAVKLEGTIDDINSHIEG